jgi:pyruvate formate lyase activating enzyme
MVGGECEDACPAAALEVVGKPWTLEALLTEVKKDEAFFRNSDGGITLGGGEPMMQAEFVRAVASRCVEMDIHTALDTSGYASEDDLMKVVDVIDLFLYDIKAMDDAVHLAYTGVSNRRILSNQLWRKLVLVRA